MNCIPASASDRKTVIFSNKVVWNDDVDVGIKQQKL
jgi:hypothetical protein